ncbi:MAG TPA: helix-turn-helix domain-containing protein [Burkholderiales bacterium]|nr:helix-turn-helix domain-containing protein [Burkholderiales bacterium]
MLDRIPGIRNACDLDLLLFFYRHPSALLTVEQLVAYLGHERERVATSLDGLIEAGLLTRSKNPSQAARLYILELHGLPGGQVSSFLQIAATRQGRIEALRLLGAAPDHAKIA